MSGNRPLEHLIKLCTDDQILKKTVAPGQCFMTKDAEEFSMFDGHVACREYTSRRHEESSTPPKRMDSGNAQDWSSFWKW